MFLAESGLLQLTAGTGASPLLEISDRSGVFEKEEFSSESLDRLIHRFERNGQSRVVADADWIFDDYLVEFRYFDDHKLQFNGNHLFLLCRFAGRRRKGTLN